MKSAIIPEKALAFTKWSILLTAIWSPDTNANTLQLKVADLVWLTSTISSTCMLIPLLVSAYAYKNNPVILAKSVCLSCAVTQVIIKAIVCRIHRKKLQFLLDELNSFLRTAQVYERRLCKQYINESASFHVIVTLCCYGPAFFVVCGPIFLPFPLPSEAKYPFAVNSSPMWEIVYVHQASVGFQASAGMCIDSLVVFLLWFTGIRFKLLYRKFKHMKSRDDMVLCIKEHQYLLRYGKKLADTFRYCIFATVLSVTAGLTFAGIYLFSPQPIFVKGQFIVVSISAGINLYVTALPTDYLIIMCENLANVVYESLWLRNSYISRDWINIVQRAQKPIKIKVSDLIKELSLQFYFSVLSSTFSYFTALHVMLTENKK